MKRKKNGAEEERKGFRVEEQQGEQGYEFIECLIAVRIRSCYSLPL